MSLAFQLAQLAFALFLLVVIGSRVRALYWREAVSDEALRWIVHTLERREFEAAKSWARARSETPIARVLEAALKDADSLPAASSPADLLELPVEPTARQAAGFVEAEAGPRMEDDTDGDLRELLADVREQAIAWLRVVRVCATLASTTGLLGGILALSAGGSGLLPLASSSVSGALTTMAIGVAISALCFQAISLLRPAAQKVVAQAHQVARAAAAALGSPLPL